MEKQKLIDLVCETIRRDVGNDDLTAIEGLLDKLFQKEALFDFLPVDEAVQFLVVSFRKPESERKTLQDHGGDYDFFYRAEDAESFVRKIARQGRWPHSGEQWTVSALDRDECCLFDWEVFVDEEDAA